MTRDATWCRAATLLVVGVLAMAGCGSSASRAGTSSFAGVRDAARADRFADSSMVVEQIDFGAAGPGANTFTARIINRGSTSLMLGLDIRTTPGMWFSPAWQRQYGFDIPPGQTQFIQATYQFTHLTPEATIRVRFGPAHLTPDGPRLIRTTFERLYNVGEGNPRAGSSLHAFRKLQTEHLELFAVKGSLAASRLSAIGAERELALKQISDLLGVKSQQRIRLVFYPDAESKHADTWHQGAGLARGNTLVEIYSVTIQLDPYHELAHILIREFGDPPALFNEGFATYVSERLGAFALQTLGHPGKKIDDVVRELASSGRLIPIRELLRYTEIGSDDSQPTVAYAEAASIVGFLIKSYGLPRFRQSLGALVNSSDPEQAERNEQQWLRVFGQSIAQIEANWRENIGDTSGRSNLRLHPSAAVPDRAGLKHSRGRLG
jgi:hypothetical protein